MKTVCPSAAAGFPLKDPARPASVCWLDPRGEILRRLCVDAQQHLGMLRSAVLRALAKIETRLPADPSTSY